MARVWLAAELMGIAVVLLAASPAQAGSGLSPVIMQSPPDWVAVHPFARSSSYVAYGRSSEGFADGCGDIGACKLDAAPLPSRRVTAASTKSGSAGGCDPNYAGKCVPITGKDVDCTGKGGDGPIFVQGPFDVVGDDVYDLDADEDGIACEPLRH